MVGGCESKDHAGLGPTLQPNGPRICEIRELTAHGAHYATWHRGVHADADDLHGKRWRDSDCDVCLRGRYVSDDEFSGLYVQPSCWIIRAI
jgi:hypothetical protein